MTPVDKHVLPNRLIVALGGNAIHPEGIRGTGEEQVSFAFKASLSLLELMQTIPELIITHGNGPGVGKVLMRQAIARDRVAAMPLDICVANSQGGISYVIMQALQNTLKACGSERKVTSVICEVEVDPQDLAFADPDKPVGYFFSEEEAKDLQEEFGWIMKQDANRGWRLVVPSPKPQRIINSEVIGSLAEQGIIVISGGGGGIPVAVDAKGQWFGLEAVIDKDLASVQLARELDIDHLLILTSVSHVAINFGRPDQRELKEVTAEELARLWDEGHFSSGSMAPKVEAAIKFIRNGGQRVVIASLEEAGPAMRGVSGTQIVRTV